MPAVVRVKRRIDEEPLSAFVLNGKKRRLDEGLTAGGVADANELGASAAEKEEISTILKFAGTIKEQDDTATSQLARLNKDAAKELVQQKATQRKPTNHTERARQEMRQSLHEHRFRVVNCLRTTLNDEDVTLDEDGATNSMANTTAKEITIVDIEKQSNDVEAADENCFNTQLQQQRQEQQTTDSDSGYVYDLYLPENEQQADYVDLMDDNYLSVRAFDDLVYEDRFNDDEDDVYDSEDSNQENNRGNDYPDEEDYELNGGCDNEEDGDESESTRQMRKAMEKFVFDDDDEDEEAAITDSSDDEDYNPYQDPYVHTVDTEEAGFVGDVDFNDVDRYGMAYARYKARILKRLKTDNNATQEDSDEAENDSSDDEYYHSASENDEYN